MRDLIEGVQRFQRSVFPPHREMFEHLAHGQTPEVLFVACADSRVDPSLLTQTPPGKLFVLRNAGNIVPRSGAGAGGEAATVAYAVDELRVHHIVVCGHSGCGAVTAALKGVGDGVIGDWLEHAGDLRGEVDGRWPDLQGEARVTAGVHVNALQQLAHLRTHPSVARAEAEGRIELHAWVYDIGSGVVTAYDRERRAFVPLDEVRDEDGLVAELHRPEPPIEEGWLDHGPWRAVLESSGKRPMAVAEAVAQLTGWTPSRVGREIIDLPTELLHGLTELEVEVVKAWIEDAGGSVRIERMDR
ncbi:MAG: carbonic anhydrase [Alphaproteobacteria bacterium]|nr:carbonic anhydrase [Alphaproteobacteria bacterium]